MTRQGPEGYVKKKVRVCGKSSSVGRTCANREELRHRSQRGKRTEWGDPRGPTISLRTPALSQRRQVGRDFKRREPSPAAHRGCQAPMGWPMPPYRGRRPPPQAVCARHGRGRSSQGTASLHGKTARPPGLARGGGRGHKDGGRREKAPSPAAARLGSQALRPHSPPQVPNWRAARPRGAECPSPRRTQNWGRKERREEGSPAVPAPQSAWWPQSSPDREACGLRRLTSASREWFPCGART